MKPRFNQGSRGTLPTAATAQRTVFRDTATAARGKGVGGIDSTRPAQTLFTARRTVPLAGRAPRGRLRSLGLGP